MKKINSINFAPTLLVIIFFLLVILPLGASLLIQYWPGAVLYAVRKVSLAIGIVLAVWLVGLWVIEFKQDTYLDKYYGANKDVLIELPNGKYECQQCGYTNVQKNDNACPICANQFDKGCVNNDKPTTWFLRP